MELFRKVRLWIKEESNQDILFVIGVVFSITIFVCWYTVNNDRYTDRYIQLEYAQEKDKVNQ